ncbi:MAG: DUF560 domain-containing protein [Rhodobacteraceae bacterium]|nr:DUF560 domain-containing protein [Paracoccaceae bacterium]
MDLRKAIWAATLVLAALSMGHVRPALAQTVVLTPDNLERAAFVLLRQGQPARALAFAEALLTQFPQDATALMLKSRAQRDMARYPQAVHTARLSWRHAQTDQDRFGAALAAAQGLASDDKRLLAQLWLRRAMDVAPTPEARHIAITDFIYVRSRTRLSVDLDLSVRPSSNVNNGSESDTLWFLGQPFTLSGDARALSGVKANLGARFRWRLAESETEKTDLRFEVQQQIVALSEEAKAQAPAAKGSDYALSGVETGLDRYWRPSARGEAIASLTLGRNWYGGDPMSAYGRVDLAYRHRLTDTLHLSGSLGLERQDRQDDDLRSATVRSISFSAAEQLANKDKLILSVAANDTQSASSDIDHTELFARLGWDRAAPVGQARLSMGISAGVRDYDQSSYSSDGRQDKTLGADLSLAFDQMDYRGFIPILSFEARKTRSNVSLYDSTTRGIALSIRSKF